MLRVIICHELSTEQGMDANRRFLLQKTREADDGLVPISLLCTFSRMRHLLGLKDTTVPEETVGEVARALEQSDQLAMSDDKQRVGRKEAMGDPAEIEREIEARSLYVKPFPIETTMDDIRSFFSQLKPVRSVRLRRHNKSKDFKGDAFVEFRSEEDAKEVAQMSGLYHAGASLIMQPKRDFIDQKKRERELAHEAQPKHPGEDGPTTRVNEDEHADDNPIHEEGFTKGLLVHFELDGAASPDLSREAVMEETKRVGSVQFVDFDRGSREGIVRFQFPEDAATFADKVHHRHVTLGGVPATARRLEGQEEVDYWRTLYKRKREKREERAHQRGGKGKPRAKPGRKRQRTS